MYYYELHSDGQLAGKFVVQYDPPRGGSVIDTWHDNAEAAAARVSYLNGGQDPEFRTTFLKLVQGFADAYMRAAGATDGIPGIFDSRASDPRCVHGKKSSEDCELCADAKICTCDSNGAHTNWCPMYEGPAGENAECLASGVAGVCYLPAGHHSPHEFK